MLNNKMYKGIDLLNDNFKERMESFFNPYGYNLEFKEKINIDKTLFKTKNHYDRRIIKK